MVIFNSCNLAMYDGVRSDVSDGVAWRCSQCKTRCSIRDGSFFTKSRLPLQKWLVAIHWWSRQYPVTDLAEEAQISKGSAIDIYQWLREVCSTTLLNTRILLGGSGVVVQVDESLFRHKPKVKLNVNLKKRYVLYKLYLKQPLQCLWQLFYLYKQ